MTENLTLTLKYRPKEFDKIIGNEIEIEKLKATLSKEGRPKTYLFHGPSGCGKTTLARIVASEVGTDLADVIELDLGSIGGIKEARQIKENSHYSSFGGGAKTYILDECHRATGNFWDGMLKTLEEPPPKTYFILCTTEFQKILKTVKTRSAIFKVSSLTERELLSLLDYVLRKERKRFPKEEKRAIVEKSDGSPRQMLSILGQVIDLKEEERLKTIKNFLTPDATAKELIDAILKREKWNRIAEILKGINDEPETIRYAILGYMNAVLLNSKAGNNNVFLIMNCFLDNFYDSKKAGLTYACYLATKNL